MSKEDQNRQEQPAIRKMPTLKQVFAWIGIGILVGLYVFTLILSLVESPLAQQMFYASLYSTFFVPIMIWIFIMTVQWVRGKAVEDTDTNEK